MNEGMKPNEIRAAMVLRGVKLKDIAEKAGVSIGAVHQVIYGIGRTRGYRIRPFIAEAIGKSVYEIWPDGQAGQEGKGKAACL